MGNVVSAGARPEPGAAGGAPRRAARHVARADDQQGVRLGPEGRDARRAGHRGRRHRHRRRRRHGVDEQRPYLLPRVREGLRMGNGEIVDSMIHDGLWCAFEHCHMGNAGEVVAEQYHVGREAQDALRRREPPEGRARHRRRAGSRDEILPIAIPQKKGDADRRRSRRADPRRHDRRGARGAEAGVQEGRHGHGRQRARRQRRRVGARRDGRRAGAARSALRRSRASSARRRAAWRRSSC